jgi:hypothetical protein
MTNSQFERIRILALTTSDPPDDWREILTMLIQKVQQQRGEIKQLEEELEFGSDDDSDFCDGCESLMGSLAKLTERVKALEGAKGK